MSLTKSEFESMFGQTQRSQSISRDGLNSETHSSRRKLQSGNLFAFQEDQFYFDQDERNANGNETFYIPHNANLENSTFLSAYNDKSQFLKINDDIYTEKVIDDDDNKSFLSLDLEYEKQIDILTEIKDDLNVARVSVNDDMSYFSSEQSSNMLRDHNMTTPNNRMIPIGEIDEKGSTERNTNHNLLSQLSLMSLLDKTLPDQQSSELRSSNKTITKPMMNTPLTMMNCYYPNGSLNPSLELQSQSVDLSNKNKIYLNYQPIHRNHIHNYNHNKYNQASISESFHSQQQGQLQHFLNPNPNPFIPLSFRNKDSRCYPNNFNEQSSSSSLYNNPNNKIYNKSYHNNFLMMLKDSSGSKQIQKKIEEKSPEFLNKLYEKMKSNLLEIFCDPSGNYVIQEYVKHCDKSLISKMLLLLQPHLYDISINNYGTRAIQELIKYSNIDNDITILMQFIEGNVLRLIKDINGNHVIQEIILAAREKDLSSLYREMNDNLIEIAMITQGGCIFPKLLSKSLRQDSDMLISKILSHIDILINNSHGNYILQAILKLNDDKYNERFFVYICDRIVELSTQKCSSNVIQVSLQNQSSIRNKIIEKLISKETFDALIIDQFGNYIIQEGLTYAIEPQLSKLVDLVKKALKTLEQAPNGKKLYDKFMRKLKEFAPVKKKTGKLSKSNKKKNMNTSNNNNKKSAK